MWDALIIQPFTNVLLFIYSVIGNFGIAIIIFTLLIRLVTHPLTVKQIKASAKMQELQQDPRYLEIQKKYKGDREKLAQEQMKLYQEIGFNPLSSCLPLLIQLPIIFGLYQSLVLAMAATPLEMLNLARKIYPGMDPAMIPLNSQFLWMDLGQPERLNLSFLPFGIPVLAILVLVTTYVQGKLLQTPTDPSNPSSGMMSGMMNIYMPILMGWMGMTLASGLAIYFVASNLFTIGQYAALGKVNWANVIPFRKRKPVVMGPSKQARPISAPRQVQVEIDERPEKRAASKVKKANITKPVKSNSSKSK